MELAFEPSGGQHPRAHDGGGGPVPKLLLDPHLIAAAGRTEGPPRGGSRATFSKMSLFSSVVDTNEEPSRKIPAITANDLEMSIAIKDRDLRCVTHVAPQENSMTVCDVSVTGLELGSKVSPVEVIELPQDPVATGSPRVVGDMAG